MNQIKLHNGYLIPQIGFGTYKATEKEGIMSVKNALECGYRLLDTAKIYGNETAVGKGIELSEIPRNEIVVTSKVWREELGYESTKRAFDASLNKLNLDFIDIYLIHWPANKKNYENWQKTNAETWKAMEELYDEGKIKAIGVSNFLPKHFLALENSAKIFPMLNQIEFHPGYWQKETYAYCQENKIALQAWSPLARGKVFENEILKNLAEKHQKSVAQICLRWIIDKGVIPIPKSTSVKRMKDNFDVFDFQLNNQEISQIDNLPQLGYGGEHPDIWPDRFDVD